MKVVTTKELEELKADFTKETATVFEAAYSIEEGAGLSSDWQDLCSKYGICGIDDQERAQVRASQRPLRGAAVMEVFDVIRAVVKKYRIAAKKIDVWDAPSNVETFHEKLIGLLERTDKEFVEAYKAAVLPKAVGGMFANVMVGHQSAAQSSSAPAATTLRCKNCSAPRLSDKDFICAYCDEPIV